MMQLSQAADAIGARLRGADVEFDGVGTDTRTMSAGKLFVALAGERYDGHAFLAQAQAAGAIAAMVNAASAGSVPLKMPALVVDDTRLALGRLAAHWRARFALPVVALTGSSGKTSVKEMLAAILRLAAAEEGGVERVLATRGNLNNDIGLPLMMLELKPEHRYAVLEMGMNHAGEIGYLAHLAQPHVALVTNAGRAHIEFLGSEEAIARAKGEIFETLPRDGTAVINADDRYAPLWRELAAGRKRIEFGTEAGHVSGTYRLQELESEIVIRTPSGEVRTRVHAPGLHNVRNALAAAAAAVALDIPVRAIGEGLERYSGIKGRLQRKSSPSGATLIDDTYNANPESVRAAIDVLSQARGSRIFVFGDMGELGEEAPRLHAEIGEYAKRAGVDRVYTLGERSAAAARAFGANAKDCTRLEDLVSDVRALLAPGVTVLVKGSRFMQMERVVAALEAPEAP